MDTARALSGLGFRSSASYESKKWVRAPQSLAAGVSRRAALCLVAVAFSVSIAAGQGSRSGGGNQGGPVAADPYAGSHGSAPEQGSPSFGTDPFMVAAAADTAMPTMLSIDTSRLVDSESCKGWTEAAVNSPTVSVSRLSVPDKASSEYQRECSAFKDKRYSEAEKHARKAIDLYPSYAAAWVVLGQTLGAENKPAEARDACSKAAAVDSRYSPSYICLADFAAADNDWEQVLKFSTHALDLDPATNMYAFFYTANADFHLHKWSDAELNGLSAEKLDTWRHLPQVHLLLGQIYQAEGKPHAEQDELRQFLKQQPNAPESTSVKQTLGQLETHPATP
jgi:TolA-binding protein